MPKMTISKMARPIILIKVKDWSTRRKVLAVVSLIAIAIILLPWLGQLLDILSVKNAVISSREGNKGNNGVYTYSLTYMYTVCATSLLRSPSDRAQLALMSK